MFKGIHGDRDWESQGGHLESKNVMYWPQAHSPSGKVTTVKGSGRTLWDCGRNLPELSDLGTRDPKGDHGAGAGAQQSNKEAGFRAVIPGWGAGPAGA